MFIVTVRLDSNPRRLEHRGVPPRQNLRCASRANSVMAASVVIRGLRGIIVRV